LPGTNYIMASCQISGGVVYKNNEPLFRDEESKDANSFLVAAYRHFGLQYLKFFKMDGLSKLGWLATEILLQGNFETGKYPAEKVGVVLTNANSSLDTDMKYYETVSDIASPALFVYTLPNIVTGEICIRHHFKGENAFFISPAFDAGFLEQYVSNLLNNNILQCCICGWVELLGEQYKTVLFLVGKEDTGTGIAFEKENINKHILVSNG
jgi:hypothetical protein